eukprot:2698740-Alexandrium_andersonii.AAC.1
MAGGGVQLLVAVFRLLCFIFILFSCHPVLCWLKCQTTSHRNTMPPVLKKPAAEVNDGHANEDNDIDEEIDMS